ncbi:alpha/beta fold hydrolase [Subsaximicrobium wynnwilliamsii]|jgi:phospholipase/carboxylesterase|uniref:Alpha/beta fold hydrolase n=1 Tax=Subsaximicrobium wynnwilliamsii TaxID=291179 RepID=A0A5C6ZLV5_9FLAO|nr:alpha/beta fold hydrolase [Subsaximicrobium wynnwilliamsii]TXD85023.1 alpha/beta fold hydrolase [Subsaximicrobium wynnwilliamsii]TXD91066.1 alpha/beta fold hydrolase [Subsaximicrobium wynnwilliamsii]TXE04460.1 alpha/beta fold hydrolase [Subsaximicrobium wynnwilliamsii]
MTSTLDYITRPSSLKDNAPLLIMLHGYGSDENDLFSFAQELPEELFIISLKAPYAMQPFGNAWYAINFDAQQNKWNDVEQAVASRDLIANFIDEACAEFPVDKSNLTLLGFSQGTILSYAVALSYPEKVKNVIALSGYVSEDMLKDDLSSKDYSHLDFYCSHGSVDQVIPVEWARKAPKFLNALNIKHSYAEFPTGHGVAPQNFYELRSWLGKRI